MEANLESLILLDISPRSRDKLIALAQIRRYQEGDTIFREGDHSLNLYLVTEGEVSLDLHDPTRGAQTVTTVEAGEWFGWSAMIEPRVETATARALLDTETLAIRGGALMDLCREDHELGFEIYRSLAVTIARRLLATRLQLLDLYGGSREDAP